MDPLKPLRKVAVTLFSVSPFFVLASLIWVSLLADLGSTDTFATHYRALLAASPVLLIVSHSLVYSFSILVIAIYAGILLVAHELLRRSVKPFWLKNFITSIFLLLGISYPALILLHTPPDGYYILIFMALLAFMFTQIRKYADFSFKASFIRWVFYSMVIAIAAMVVMLAAALVWLLTFWQSSISQPWLSAITLTFMIITSIVMAVTTGLTVVDLARSFPFLRENS